MARRQYRNPPIHEAICEIRFAPGNEWNPVYPALFYERVKDKYSGKPREQKLVSVQPNPRETGPQRGSAMAVNEITRLQFVDQSNTKIIGIYPDVLSVSVLRPYKGWETFRPEIEGALKAYCEIAEPNGIRRIGVRYINQIFVAGDLPELLRCFVTPLMLLPNVDCKIHNFTARHEYVYGDEPIKIAVAFARMVAPEGTTGGLLDIDLVWEWPAEPLPLEQAMGKVDNLRDRERIAFEALITDHAREIFDA